MDYERIHKLQTGVLSPSKLRMKLIGAGHNLRKKDGSKQSNTSSSTTSPSKYQDSDYGQLVKDSFLLSAEHEAKGFDEEGLKLELSSANSCSQGGQSSPQSQESVSKDGWSKKKQQQQQQQVRKSESANRLSTVHPARTTAEDDQNLDYDSNASSSSFEFPNGERARPSQLSRSFSRPASSKWNDAEKWIMSRPAANQASKKKSVMLNPKTRFPMIRVSPESSGEDKVAGGGLSRMLQTEQVDFCQPASQVGLDKFSFAPANVNSTATQSEDKAGPSVVRAVAMRDMGTEMTPMASQDPSRTSTPVGASTPLCSPTVSIPSTPGRELPTPTFSAASRSLQLDDKKIASEQEQKLKTRREIMALGVQLGKKNIAAWASKEEKEHCAGQVKMTGLSEFQVRAAAWEQVEMTKHEARFRRKEVMIQVWESMQKSKLEAEMRRIEAKVEEMRCQCQTKMLQKIATARHRSEVKRAKAEARKNRQAERSAAMAGYIDRKGHIPYSYICCGWA